MSEHQPVVAVLCAEHGPRPAHLETLATRVSLRYTDEKGLAEAVDGAQVLLLWDFFSSAVAQVWEHCGALRWIHVAAAGVDKLLFDDLRASEVVVTNARGVFDRPIAEYVLGALLADVKELHESHDLQRSHTWTHRETRTLVGSRAIVVGTGGIGREIARLLRAVGVQVRGAGRTARAADDDFDEIIASGDLPQHVGEVDYLINAAPLTAATRDLIDASVFAAMPARGYLVNIGRGESVVEADLVAAVRSGRLRGACLDVFQEEPLRGDSPLWDLAGVTVTPHMSGDTLGWRDDLAHQFVDIAQSFLDGRPMPNVIDKQLGFVAT
ncbi:D-2-hydroxyacid dehydrogenase [Leekyejoonella antrihumi]|uniref:D-2-hydroxyacid dehydrogenase n=1 Tax=Leekyejoonella antrihumi TaxID=1660198 RepID=A0A563E0I5_9MICO|nr:D-2-hydroxyacid dehydrogenase [Leekyejoonella antrihumi]TWP35711.1 D-2-hydroxyacid dehydrogenase [Leekyejoonella antrihumi]